MSLASPARLGLSTATAAAFPCRRLARPTASPPRCRHGHLPAPSPLFALPGTDPGSSLPLNDEERSQLPSWLTLAGYAATQLAHRTQLTSFQLKAQHIYTALAWYTLTWAALSALDRTTAHYDPVATTVGPVFLAANALDFWGGRVSPFGTAAALFGYFWIDQLPAFPYSRLAWMVSLAAAVCYGAGSQWLVGAFGLAALTRMLRQRDSGSGFRPQELAFVGFASWALLKKMDMPVSLLIMAAQMVDSLIT